MEKIAKETRKESFEEIQKTNLRDLVYQELEDEKLTARQLAKKMYKKRNY